MNGSLVNVAAPPTVEMVDSDGVVLLDTVTATLDTLGTYFADYDVPISLPPGQYYDRWKFKWDAAEDEQEFVQTFHVHTRDSIINFIGTSSSLNINARMAELMNDLVNEFIFEAQHIPIHWEQGQRTADNTRFKFAYRNWLKDPRPLLRLNGTLLDDGWYADFNGNVYFEEPLRSSDVVTVDYQFAYFSDIEIAGFIKQGLSALNSMPPATNSYRDVAAAPRFWDYGIILSAAIHALRRLVFGLNFQERAIIFGEPSADGTFSGAQNAQSSIQGLYSDYSELWKDVADGIKKELPQIAVTVQPEYTLPGGRARWFRYAFAVSGG
jgi:hypothetical protein